MTRREWLLSTPVVCLAASNPLDEVFEYLKTTTRHGGLLVQRSGRLIYERYFGRAHRDATPNLASVGKSFTSVAAGILMDEKPRLFPSGLDTKIFTERLMPRAVFPLNDDRKAEIQLGQILTMTSGIRGNSPGYVRGRAVPVEPPGLDGWQAMVDENAVQADLWCEPGAGYSYATAGVHLASMMIRHVSGVELQEYIADRIAKPLGWGRWGFGYSRKEITHTPGGGGIQLRGPDIVRFGEMMLRGGEWNGKQVVPRAYVERCGTSSPYNPHYPYSLQFDVNTDRHVAGAPPDAFWKQGSGGHCLYLVPSRELVVWKLGGRDDQYGPEDRDDGSRAGFRPAVAADVAAHRTIEMVIERIR
jgi:CubicO group peptidase (beta-lactamase class C family)